MGYLDIPGIKLANDEYDLVEDGARDGRGQLMARSWQYKFKQRPTKRVYRPDVQPSEIAGRKTIVWDDWSKGACGELENRPGSLHMAEGCNGLTPGALRAGSNIIAQTVKADEPCEPLQPLVFNGTTFTFHGRYVLAYSNGTVAEDKDFGTGVIATCAFLHNNNLIVGFGGSTNVIFSRNASGTWTNTMVSSNVYADLLARANNQLFRITDGNKLSNLPLATDNPLDSTKWSASNYIGDITTGATCLLGVGERIFVCKPEGMFAGDLAAKFQNVLDGFVNQVHPDNGKRAIAVGSVIYYPHEGGLLKYDTEAGYAEEIGIQLQMLSASPDKAPGTRVYGLAADGNAIWAACGVSGYGRAAPQYVKKTTDVGSSYSNLLTNTTDGDMGTTGDISSLDTAANGDWLLVGYSEQFAGVVFEMNTTNGNAATMTVDFSIAGPAFGTTPGLAAIDRTNLPTLATPLAQGTKTFATSGYVAWAVNSPDAASNWIATTVDGVSAYWARFKVSAALDSSVTIGEIRVLKGLNGASPDSYGWIYRGRPARASDNVDSSVVWEPVDALQWAVVPTGLAVVSGSPYPHRRGKALVVSYPCGDQVILTQGAQTAFETGPQSYSRGGMATSCRHDGGSPNVLKQFHSITVAGKCIDSTRDVKLEYRKDFDTSWTTAASSITSSPTTTTLSGITGYRIQWRITFNAFTATNEQATEVNLVECDVSEIPASRKREWDYLVKIAAGDVDDPATKLALLEGYIDDVAMVHLDPLRRSFTVNVLDVGAAELYRPPDGGLPALAVPIRVVEI